MRVEPVVVPYFGETADDALRPDVVVRAKPYVPSDKGKGVNDSAGTNNSPFFDDCRRMDLSRTLDHVGLSCQALRSIVQSVLVSV